MNQQRLHLQADRIEWVLYTHKAPARVTGGRVTPRTIQFHLTPAPTTKIAQVERLCEEIALALGASSARIARLNGQLSVEVPRADTRGLRFLELADRVRTHAQLDQIVANPGTALLGLDTAGVPVLLRLGAPDVPHVLIAGTTGSGKTEAAKTMLASMMLFQKPRDLQLIVVDPKGSAFKLFEQLPHLLCPIIKNVEDALANLEWLVAEMQRREEGEIARPRVVLLLDELADLLMQGGREVEDQLTRLVQRGRSAGISVIACTQKPTSAAVGSLVKANFPVRLVGKVTSAVEAHVAAGLAGTGAEKLAGRGDFILIAGGEKLRLQVAHLPSADHGDFRARVDASSRHPRDYRVRASEPGTPYAPQGASEVHDASLLPSWLGRMARVG
jgi:DNA segregation ATPase FtsK/SpoIIIE, S-DNA-T family